MTPEQIEMIKKRCEAAKKNANVAWSMLHYDIPALIKAVEELQKRLIPLPMANQDCDYGKCPNCGASFTDNYPNQDEFDYCPFCGQRMYFDICDRRNREGKYGCCGCEKDDRRRKERGTK